MLNSNIAIITDVHFKEWQEVISTIGGLSTSFIGVLTLMFSMLIYNEWEWSILVSIIDNSKEELKGMHQLKKNNE